MNLNKRLKYGFLATLLLWPFLLASQGIVVTDSIAWEGIETRQSQGTQVRLLTFRSATNHDQYGLLPVYHYQVPLSSPDVSARASLLSFENKPLGPSTEPGFEDLSLAGNSFRVFSEVNIAARKSFLSVYVVPVRKEEDMTFILTRFTLGIEIGETAVGGRSGPGEADVSVLSEGSWYKIGVRQTGIHRITFNDLAELGIEPASIDPGHLRIYGNGNKMLPEANSSPHPDDLREISIYVHGEEDGFFNPGDYILFYGEGPVEWAYSPFFQNYYHINHLYTDRIFYFLSTDLGPGKRVTAAAVSSGTPDIIINSNDIFDAHDQDLVNVIKSGKDWYGETFSDQTSWDFEFRVPDVITSEPATAKLYFAARSSENSKFRVLIEGQQLLEEEIVAVNINSAIYARNSTPAPVAFFPQDEIINITIEYDKPNTTSIGWLNYIELNATAGLKWEGGQMPFRNRNSIGENMIARYEIEALSPGAVIWNVSDASDIRNIIYEASGNIVSFSHSGDTLNEFVIFDDSDYYPIDIYGEVPNQNLHGLAPPDLVIIAPELFLEEAGRLAGHHRSFDGLDVGIVTPGQIYNEFSSGAQDVVAIRNFLRMLYHRSTESEGLRYVLFFGDASYDYLDRIENNTNLVPTFQSKESLRLASSFVTDDFFACFDLNEGSNAAGNPDIGTGRFPVTTVEQARQAVDKVILYAQRSREVMGSWRNNIAFVADDGDNNTHLKQAEGLNDIVDTTVRGYNRNKIYLDAYTQLTTPGGNRYPDVNEAIDRSVDEGVLIMNYTGHGGELGWADERVLDIPMINLWENTGNLPAFVTATCEFSRFDDPEHVSAGEEVFLNPVGAGIGLFTTTRLAYSQSNYGLNQKFYQNAFTYDSVRGEFPRMGDLIRNSKNPSNSNIRNFVLLGDPALMLAYPMHTVRATRITNDFTGEEADTIKALSRITLEGQVEDHSGNLLPFFNGIVSVTVFDKPITYKTLGNDQNSKVTTFELQNKVLFKGDATVREGLFSISFVVPRDIVYYPDTGKISMYAYDTLNYADASGYRELIVGGADENAGTDNEGPVIEMYLNHTGFRSGDVTTENPTLLAYLSDENGINSISNGIGHDITLVIDGNHNEPVVLNDYYRAMPDSYQEGSVTYPLGNFGDGEHSLTLKAWDVYNNSSEKTIWFEVQSGYPISLLGVYNYPNPFRDYTRFAFSHNKPGDELDVRIDIYNLMGQYITTLEASFTTEMTEAAPIYWDGRNEEGDLLSSGLYIYRLTVRSSQGFTAWQTSKLLIVR